VPRTFLTVRVRRAVRSTQLRSHAPPHSRVIDEMTTTQPRTRPDDGFPGGRARLPFHYDPQRFSTEVIEEPRVIDGSTEPEGTGGFFDYFSTESLFSGHSEEDPVVESDRPYAVLGLSRAATWSEITQRHRSLMKQFHPDRHVSSDEATRAHAEQRVRDINEAIATLREQRRT